MTRKIKTKFLINTIPYLVLIMLLGYFASACIARSALTTQVSKRISAIQEEHFTQINDFIGYIEGSAIEYSFFISRAYKNTPLENYTALSQAVISNKQFMYGFGVWFEPYVYDETSEKSFAYVTYIDGETKEFNSIQDSSYDYFSQDYYTLAKENRKGIITDPFQDELSGEILITYAYPIIDTNDTFLGVITMDFEISEIFQYFAQYGTDEFDLYILDRNGDYLSKSNVNFDIMADNIYHTKNDWLMANVDSIMSNQSGTFHITAEEQEYIFSYETVESLGWKCIYVVPKKVITEPILLIAYSFTFIAIVVILLLILTINYFAVKIVTNPVNIIINEIDSISKNNYATNLDDRKIHSGDEFEQIEVSLAEMKLKLKQYQTDIEEQNTLLEESETTLLNQLQEIKYLSTHDSMTGLGNRTKFTHYIEQCLENHVYPLSIITCSMNGLKKINDTFGRKEGDAHILAFVNILKKSIADNECVFRTSGDEFSIVLKETDLTKANKAVDTMISICTDVVSTSFGVSTMKSASDSLETIIQQSEDSMYTNKFFTADNKNGSTIKIINNALLAKNKREQLHSERVSYLCEKTAYCMGMSKNDQNKLKIAGLLHDIGKIGISEVLLDKPGKLTSEEYAEVCNHSEIGYTILSSSEHLCEISEIVHSHHEKWDGTGYPRNLKGEEIPLEARIITIADSYDAMTSDRSYRNGLPANIAIEELKKCKGTHFDPELVDIFIKKVLCDSHYII